MTTPDTNTALAAAARYADLLAQLRHGLADAGLSVPVEVSDLDVVRTAITAVEEWKRTTAPASVLPRTQDAVPLDDAELAEIEARAAKATEGPWRWEDGILQQPYVPHDIVMWPTNAINGSHDDDGEVTAGEQVGAVGDHAEEHAADNMAFIAAARDTVPRLAAALRAAREERDQAQAARRTAHEYAVSRDKTIAAVREELKRQTDRAGLLRDALADAARNIPGVTDASNRANAVLRADTDGTLSPRHTDGMGRPQYCDDAQAEVVRLRGDHRKAIESYELKVADVH